MIGKRFFDVVASAVGLLLLAPVLAVLWVVVRIDSPGPALYRQTRVGRHGRPFTILKLRSMHVSGEGGRSITPAGDRRITRAGRVLRRTRLDELPQLLNVLAGSMSLVGPRPEVPAYVAQWDASARDVILTLRPGITDPAAIAFLHEDRLLAEAPDPEDYYVSVILPEKQRLYVRYVRERSFVGDLRTIGATLLRVAPGRPADAAPPVGATTSRSASDGAH